MTISVFVDKENKATFTCPSCAKVRTADVSKFMGLKKMAKLKAKCPCGHVYSVVLERRKFYRKETNLPGAFVNEKNGRQYPMTVSNLSRSGLEIQTAESGSLQIGERVTVEFRLDDKARSIIKKKAIIRKINGKSVGAEFCFLDQYDRVLGFYLFK